MIELARRSRRKPEAETPAETPAEEVKAIENGVVEQVLRDVIKEHVAKAPSIVEVLRDPWKSYLDWLSGLKRLLD